jgi:hypothetical protein
LTAGLRRAIFSSYAALEQLLNTTEGASGKSTKILKQFESSNIKLVI